MPHRLIAALVLALVTSFALVPSAFARGVVLAQAEQEEGADQSEAGTDTEGGGETTGDDLGEGGEGEPGAETGAGEDEQAATEEEEGPQWTYQMARITLVMLLLLMLAVGAMYYRMVARRQRGV